MGPWFNSYLSYKFDLARKDMWLSKNKFGLSFMSGDSPEII